MTFKPASNYSALRAWKPVQGAQTDPVLMVMSALAISGGIARLLFLDLEKTTRRGLLTRGLFSARTVSGVVGVLRGARMWRKDRGSPRPDNEAEGRPGGRVSQRFHDQSRVDVDARCVLIFDGAAHERHPDSPVSVRSGLEPWHLDDRIGLGENSERDEALDDQRAKTATRVRCTRRIFAALTRVSGDVARRSAVDVMPGR